MRTLAAPINPADVNIIQGVYGATPPMSTDLGTGKPAALPGNEGCLEIVAVAADQEDLASSSSSPPSTGPSFKPGDWAIPSRPFFGTWRTHAVVPSSLLFRVNRLGLSASQVATVSVNPSTAYRILRHYGPRFATDPRSSPSSPPLDGRMTPLQPGSGAWFILNAANSGVGRAAIQLGAAWGLRSIAVVRERSSPGAVDALRAELGELGATAVHTETELLASDWPSRLDSLTRNRREPVSLALDCVGGPSAVALADSLAPGGTLVTYGCMSRVRPHIPVSRLLFRDVAHVGFWLTRWNERDPVGRGYVVNDLLDMTRRGSMQLPPLDEIHWNEDSTEETLRDAVAGTLEGFRSGKSIFVFDAD